MSVRSKITLRHENGSVWEPARKRIGATACFVLSNKNPLKHPNPTSGDADRGNKERFEIYCPDERSVINGLQAGLSIRMTGVGDNGKTQTNLFVGRRILIDGASVMDVEPNIGS